MADESIRVAQIMGKWVGGGVESVVMNYYRHINKSKIQFDFICDEDSTNIPYEEIESLGGKVILIPPYQKLISYQKKLIDILRKNNYKIVHSHINSLSIFPLRASKKANIPIRIAHSHSTTNKKEWKKNLLKQSLKPFSKIYATNYFCCTEHAGRWLFGDKVYDNEEVYLLNNAIDLNRFEYDEAKRKEIRREYKIKDSTLVIGHIGRFVEQKNHDFLLDIFNEIHKKNPDSMLFLVGQGPLLEKTKNKAKELKLDKYINFLGQVVDVEKFYQLFDIFVFPSLYEGLGMVLIEAQCCGLPCICSTEVPKVAKVTENIKFIDLNESADEWSKKILKMIKGYVRKNYRKEVSNNGYDISKEVKKLEKKYINLINKVKINEK